MSIKTSAAVWQHSRLKGNALLCLLSIADRAKDDGFAWPGIADIARRVRLSERNVRKSLQKAQEAGELYVHARPGRNHQYLVLVGLYEHEIEAALVRRFELNEQAIEVFWQDRSVRGAHSSGGMQPSGGADAVIPTGEDAPILGGRMLPSSESLINQVNNNLQENGTALSLQKPKHEEFWERYCRTVEEDRGGAWAYKEILRGTRALGMDEKSLQIGVTDEFQRSWLEARATRTVERALIGIANKELEVKFVMVES